jgi:hypothetical protein
MALALKNSRRFLHFIPETGVFLERPFPQPIQATDDPA